MIAVSCGIKISAVHCLFVTKHACNKETDGQNYNSKLDRAMAYLRRAVISGYRAYIIRV